MSKNEIDSERSAKNYSTEERYPSLEDSNYMVDFWTKRIEYYRNKIDDIEKVLQTHYNRHPDQKEHFDEIRRKNRGSFSQQQSEDGIDKCDYTGICQ